MKKFYSIIILVFLVSFLPSQKSYSLKCVEPPSPEVAIHKYDVVVIATVTDMKKASTCIIKKKDQE